MRVSSGALAFVDVLVQRRTARIDHPLTYAVPAGLHVGVGDVVRVPLGSAELYGYVVSEPSESTGVAGVRALTNRVDVPAAFDAEALALAGWMAEQYCCTLGEALDSMVFTAALPRTVDRLVPRPRLTAANFPAVPARLVRLIVEDFSDGFRLETLLRHPEARRAGDRQTLRRAIAALTRGGALQRIRSMDGARIAPAQERVLEATGKLVRGPRASALVRRIAEEGVLRRSDALLAGFSQALIARAVRDGALLETSRPAGSVRTLGRREEQDFQPTPAQRHAIDAIVARVQSERFAEVLLQGVTGSGKTFVYIRAIAATLAAGDRAIVLVPEIALTPQTARRFETVFGRRVAVLHSGLSERERFESWEAARRGDIDVIVGARSALFAPLPRVRLILIDEAHERTYKQDSVPRYNAVEVARERMRVRAGVLVLGSATPPLEAYAAAIRGEVEHLVLATRATALPMPATRIVDMTREFAAGNRRIFSAALVGAMETRLNRREKTVLFVNRRGTASFMLCRACGAVPTCLRCSVSLTVHRAERLLRCHLCDAQRPIPEACAGCGRGPVREFGVGTQKVAETAQALFPQARIVRMDGDTTTRIGDHARLLDAFEASGDILVGTQMVAKGLDFPEVTLVGVVAADIGLHVPDFRASERTFGLVAQVTGRSGRSRPGEAIVQTYSPDHPAIRFAAAHDFDGFARRELELRGELAYPPFAELTYLGVIGRSREETLAAARRYSDMARAVAGVEVLGPAPYPVARVNSEWRFRIALKSADGESARAFVRKTLQPLAASERTTRLVVNVRP